MCLGLYGTPRTSTCIWSFSIREHGRFSKDSSAVTVVLALFPPRDNRKMAAQIFEVQNTPLPMTSISILVLLGLIYHSCTFSWLYNFLLRLTDPTSITVRYSQQNIIDNVYPRALFPIPVYRYRSEVLRSYAFWGHAYKHYECSRGGSRR